MAKKVIASGNITDQALTWLAAHLAKIEHTLSISVVELPEKAMVDKGAHSWDYTISFYGEDGNYEDEYAVVELDVNCYETRVYLKKE